MFSIFLFFLLFTILVIGIIRLCILQPGFKIIPILTILFCIDMFEDIFFSIIDMLVDSTEDK